MHATRYFVVIGILLLGSCSSVDVTRTDRDAFAPTDPNEVRIIRTKPDGDFTEIATFAASGYSASNAEWMHEDIREEAAEIGGHAALIRDQGMVRLELGLFQQWCTGVVIRHATSIRDSSRAPVPGIPLESSSGEDMSRR